MVFWGAALACVRHPLVGYVSWLIRERRRHGDRAEGFVVRVTGVAVLGSVYSRFCGSTHLE